MTEKLVRDLIPEIMRQAGNIPSFRVLPKAERLQWLLAKLFEEAEELRERPSIDECADVLEVLIAITAELGYDESSLRAAAIAKACARGRFSAGYVLRIDGEPT